MGQATEALVIIDIQNFYFEGGNTPLVEPIAASKVAGDVLEHFRKEGKLIIHVQHKWEKDTAYTAEEEYQVTIHPNVAPKEGEKIVVKHYPNSFQKTELLEYLRKHGIEELVVCGMMTHMCIDASVRASKDFGFNCTLISDACTTKDLEVQGQVVPAAQVHSSFLAAMNGYYAKVLTAEDYLSE